MTATAAPPRRSPSTLWATRASRARNEAVTARRCANHCEAQDVPDMLALRPRQDSQVTVDGRLGKPAG
jgi:hypothetical protein